MVGWWWVRGEMLIKNEGICKVWERESVEDGRKKREMFNIVSEREGIFQMVREGRNE